MTFMSSDQKIVAIISHLTGFWYKNKIKEQEYWLQVSYSCIIVGDIMIIIIISSSSNDGNAVTLLS